MQFLENDVFQLIQQLIDYNIFHYTNTRIR